jgi:hypothetical protein
VHSWTKKNEGKYLPITLDCLAFSAKQYSMKKHQEWRYQPFSGQDY